MTQNPEMAPEIDGKAAYFAAQKKRNLFIGVGLAAFVALVFFISMARMAQGIRHDSLRSAEIRASQSAPASASR
jgi:ABC-type transport system involved in cytochrome c biogenesis permease subunit